MVKEIRNNNTAFHQYMNEARLHTLKYEDIVLFEERYHREKIPLTVDKRTKKKSLQCVKIGFQEFKKKVEEYGYFDFLNEMNYYAAAF